MMAPASTTPAMMARVLFLKSILRMLAASILNMDFKKSTVATLAGVLLAGAIVLAAALLGLGAYQMVK